ncbi:MAG: hypothetical protein GX569_07155 [Candidatus Riflebacteria bacterium]|nr:hypothetical protein [Candidatus Riflebacteria bacterium]
MKFRFFLLIFLLSITLFPGVSTVSAADETSGSMFDIDASGDNSATVAGSESSEASDKLARRMSKFEQSIIKGLDKFEKSVQKLSQKLDENTDSIASVLAAASTGSDSQEQYESQKVSIGNSLKNLFNSLKDLIKTVVKVVKTAISDVSQKVQDIAKDKQDKKKPETSNSKKAAEPPTKPGQTKPAQQQSQTKPAKQTSQAKPAKPQTAKTSTPAPKSSGKDDIDLSQVAWDGHDIRNWPVTSNLSAGVVGGKVNLKHDKANTWPDVGKKASDGGPVTGNAWVIAKINGQWRAATWEWLRKGQQSKAATSIAGDHVKRGTWPKDWRPSPGETIYIAVSGLCRDKTRNVSERSQFKKVVWP